MDYQDLRYYNFSGQKKEEKPLVETLSETQINEFLRYIKDYEEKVQVKYGVPRVTGKLNVQQYKGILEKIGLCRSEGIVEYKNKRNRETINFAKFFVKNEKCGDDAFATLNVEVMERIKLPWVRRFHIFDHQFQMEYRELNGKKFVCLKKEFDYQNKFSAIYRLIIREP